MQIVYPYMIILFYVLSFLNNKLLRESFAWQFANVSLSAELFLYMRHTCPCSVVRPRRAHAETCRATSSEAHREAGWWAECGPWLQLD